MQCSLPNAPIVGSPTTMIIAGHVVQSSLANAPTLSSDPRRTHRKQDCRTRLLSDHVQPFAGASKRSVPAMGTRAMRNDSPEPT